jgi:hypothetical protein
VRRASADGSRLAAGDPAYQQVFTRSPYVEACAVWDTPGTEAPAPAMPHGTPLLLLPGQFDSFSGPQWSIARAGEHEQAWAFTAPNNTHNTLGYDECAIGFELLRAGLPFRHSKEVTVDKSYRRPKTSGEG